MLKLLSQLEKVEGDRKDKEVKQFTDTIASIKKLGGKADKMLDIMTKADENWFLSGLVKIFK
jgi:hypothetical protein